MSVMVSFFLKLYVFKYFLETAGILALLAMPFPKRKLAPLWAAIALAAGMAASAVWTRELSSIFWLRLLRYFVLTGIIWSGAFALLDTTPLLALYAAMSAVALQHISVRLHDVLSFVFGLTPYSGASIALSLFSLLLTGFGTWFIFVKRFRNEEIDNISNRWTLFTGSGIVLIVLILSQIPQIGFPPAAQMLAYIYDTIGCLFGLALLYAVFRTGKLESEVVSLQELIEKEERQRALRSENMELVNIKCHDIKKQLASLGGRIEDNELRSLENLVEIYDSGYRTGNRTLDVILAEKSLYCGQNGIRLTCMAEGEILSFMSVSDIYSIFGNAIDNAVTAVEQLPPEQRVIALTLRENMGMLSAHIENYYEGTLDLSEGLPKTTKDDNNYHGFGMKSIAYTVRKYGGNLSVKTENGVFALDLLIPIPEPA